MHRNNEQSSRSRYSQRKTCKCPSYILNLKPKFNLEALTFLRDKGIFCGEALGHVNCTLHRLKATTETEFESEEEQSGEEREETDQSVD